MVKLFLLICDNPKCIEDHNWIKLIVILSQTFYLIDNGKKLYIQSFIKSHSLFKDINVWSYYINKCIEEDLDKVKKFVSKSNIKLSEDEKQNNTLKAELIPFCDNMIDFGMNYEDIQKIIVPIMNKYNVKEDLKIMLNELVIAKLEIEKSKEKQNDKNIENDDKINTGKENEIQEISSKSESENKNETKNIETEKLNQENIDIIENKETNREKKEIIYIVNKKELLNNNDNNNLNREENIDNENKDNINIEKDIEENNHDNKVKENNLKVEETIDERIEKKEKIEDKNTEEIINGNIESSK